MLLAVLEGFWRLGRGAQPAGMTVSPNQTSAGRLKHLIDEIASGYAAASQEAESGVDLTRGEVRLDLTKIAADLHLVAAHFHYQAPRGDDALRAGYLSAAREAGIETAHLDLDDVMVCAGGKQAMHLAMHSLVRPGERILLPRPGWAPYSLWAKSLGAAPIYYDATDPSGADLLDRLQSQAVQSVVVNSPNNPCGAELSADAIDAVARQAGAVGAVILSDEVYRHFASDRSASFLPYVGGEVVRVAVIDSVSKWLGAAGLRIGFLVAERATLDLAATLRGTIDSCPSGPSQAIAATLLSKSDPSTPTVIRRFVQARLDGFESLLAANGVSSVSRGGLYVWVEGPGAELRLATRGGISMRGVCGSMFGRRGYVRFCPTGISGPAASSLGLIASEDVSAA